MPAPSIVTMEWRGAISAFLQDETREIDLEGALSSGKTTACLWKEFSALQSLPGVWSFMCRFGDGDTSSKLCPAFEAICHKAGCVPAWKPDELFYAFPNGSRMYAFGLKSPDHLSRYAKLRGLGVSRIYNDQTEELPGDFSGELRARMRQERFPHQLTFSPNPPDEGHWLVTEFPVANTLPGRRYYSVSLFDNAHNLPPATVAALVTAFPPEHAKHRSVILGKRGMNVTGDPVYKGAFVRASHEGVAEFDAALELQMALDFGKHHPYALFRQVSVVGQIRYLGGIFGQHLYLDDFLDIVLERRAQWFPNPASLRECCDPAGTQDTSHGTEGAVKILRAKGLRPIAHPGSNSPAIRLGAIERIASQMKQRAADRSEKFLISNSDRWIRVSTDGVKPDRVYVDGCEAGYVWSPHFTSVGNKQVRVPKKDGWYEHAQNCAEYLEINFGATPRTHKRDDAPARLATYAGGPLSWMA
jgi:hypothetical protein